MKTETPGRGSKRHSCETWNFTSVNRGALYNHEKAHKRASDAAETFICPSCQGAYSSKKSL